MLGKLVCYLVVYVAVGKHGVEVLHALASTAVVVVLQALLDGAHVHWMLDDLMIILWKNRGWMISCDVRRSTAPSSQVHRFQMTRWRVTHKQIIRMPSTAQNEQADIC